MRWLPRALNAPIAFQSAILGALVVLPVVVTAHHSRVEYTYGAMHEIEGEVIRVLWRNPHIMFTVRAIDAGGSVKDWVLEGPGAGPEGHMAGHVSEGDRVRAAGRRSDRRDDWLRLAHILGPSGPELVFTGGGPLWSDTYLGGDQKADKAIVQDVARPNGIFRVWVWTGGTPYEIDELPPLTTDALAAYQAYDPLRDDPALVCNPPGVPRITTIAGSRPFEFIEQENGTILMRAQNYNQTRVIHMNAESPSNDVQASRLGYSRGRWEGETLVVTTNKISYPFFDLPPWWGVPQTESQEIVEKFTLDGDALVYDFWAYDPATFEEPIDRPAFFTFTWQPGLRVETDNCEPYFEDA
jgi:hypothetical protein